MLVIESAGQTDTGKVRRDNEDALLVDDELGLYVIADGMGGHRAGEVASRIVIESLHDYVKGCRNGAAPPQPVVVDPSLSDEANRILSAIAVSNRKVKEAAEATEEYLGMGSTVSAVYVNERTLVAANVGDSPIYLIHKGRIELLSVSHTVLAEHAAINPIGTALLSSEFKHVLTRAVGTEAEVKADICEVPYFKDDILVIGSDGLTDLVEAEEIQESVTSHSPCTACRQLVDLANARGGLDNISVIVLKVKKAGRGDGKMKRLFMRVTQGFRAPDK